MKGLKRNSEMKPFDIELAKANHPVQTRDGRSVRILCYNRASNLDIYPIVALVKTDDTENTIYYSREGIYSDSGETCLDLFMAPAKKEGWVNIYPSKPLETLRKQVSEVYNSKEEALRYKFNGCIATIKIEWEE